MKGKQKDIDGTLLLRIIENKADNSEAVLFKKWQNESAENAALFAQLKKAHELSIFDTHSTQANWKKIVDKIGSGYEVPDYIELPSLQKPGRNVRMNEWLRVAAAIIILIGISFLFKIIVFNPEQIIVSGNDLKNNEPYEMSDGSLVYLNDNAEISFNKKFGSKNRALTLKGEAFFEVQRNEKLPFQISSNHTITRVLGTSFNVFSDKAGKVKVSVVSGIVEFYSERRNSVELRAGEQGTYIPEVADIRKNEINDPNFQSWKTGIVIFEDTPLEEALEVLSRHYAKVFLFWGNNNKLPKITTKFDNQSMGDVLEELNLLLNTKNEIKNDTIIFEPNI